MQECVIFFCACDPRAHRPFKVSNTLSRAGPIEYFHGGSCTSVGPVCLLTEALLIPESVVNPFGECLRYVLSLSLSDTGLMWKMQWCCRIRLYTKDSTKQCSGICALQQCCRQCCPVPPPWSCFSMFLVPRGLHSLFSSLSTTVLDIFWRLSAAFSCSKNLNGRYVRANTTCVLSFLRSKLSHCLWLIILLCVSWSMCILNMCLITTWLFYSTSPT